jgi:phospholipid/cholesterol/gamma-HCH transport system permease protein
LSRVPPGRLPSFAADAVEGIGAMVGWTVGKVVGRFLSWVHSLGEVSQLLLRNPELFMQQVVRVGISSLPLILVISVFIGAVTAIQAKYQFRGLIPDTYLGTAICKFVIIESGPVITALVLAGRVGSAIAAEIGTMKEKEELDALVVLGSWPAS